MSWVYLGLFIIVLAFVVYAVSKRDRNLNDFGDFLDEKIDDNSDSINAFLDGRKHKRRKPSRPDRRPR